MKQKCPQCGEPLDEKRPLVCNSCNLDLQKYIKMHLDDLKKTFDFLPNYHEIIEFIIAKKVREHFWRYILYALAILGIAFASFSLFFSLFFYSWMENKTKEIAVEKFDSLITEQLKEPIKEFEFMKYRNKFIKLGDKAIVEGGRDAIDRLFSSKKEVTNNKELLAAIDAEILRVEFFYWFVSRCEKHQITFTDNKGKKLINEEIPTDVLIDKLLNDTSWKDRAKAAQLFAYKRTGNDTVRKALLQAICKDKRLDVIANSARALIHLFPDLESDGSYFDCNAWKKELSKKNSGLTQ